MHNFVAAIGSIQQLGEFMKARVLGINSWKSVLAAAIIAAIPQMAQATSTQTTATSVKTSQSIEIADLKQQIYRCHHHHHHRHLARHHAASCTTEKISQQTEKQTIVEKPVIVEKVVEKIVYVDRPAVVERQIAIETPIETVQQVVVEHSKHRTHMLHFGIPFISVSLL